MKIIFLGTPNFAKNVLEKLINSSHQVVAVICQPDRPVGRKQILTPPPTKLFAIEHNIPVFQFEKIRKEGVEVLKSLNADIMITAAYGQILSQEILDVTKHGVFNVHGSLLPKYRGSSPVQWAIINGEEKTGVTIMKTNIGMDTGDMIAKCEVAIEKQDTVESILNKLSLCGADLLVDVLKTVENGSVRFEKQKESESSYYPMLSREMALIDFNKSAKQIFNFVRGLEEWPTAYATLNGEVLKIYKADYLENNEFCNEANGTIVVCSAKKGVLIKTQDGLLKAEVVQLGTGKKVDGKSFANGHSNLQGIVLNNGNIVR